MSVLLHGLALKAALSPNLRAVLQALCDAAGEDDGSHCHPSIEYVAYKSGLSVRQCQRILRAFEDARYIEPLLWLQGGRGHTTHYQIHIERIPMKPNWGDMKKFLIEQGRYVQDEVAANADGKRAHTQKGDKMSPIPETELKGDILSPIEPVKGDILSPIEPERVTFCHPNILSSISIPRGDEDSYAETPPSVENEPSDTPDEPPLVAFHARYPDVTAFARKTGRHWYTTARENADTKDAYWLAEEVARAAQVAWERDRAAHTPRATAPTPTGVTPAH